MRLQSIFISKIFLFNFIMVAYDALPQD